MNYEELLEKAKEIYESEDTPLFFKAWLLANIICPTNVNIEDDVKRRSTTQVFEYARSLDACTQYSRANIDRLVAEYSKAEDGDFGLPVNCMIRAYRKGINDALKLSLNLEKQGSQTHVELDHSEVTKTSDQELEPKFKVGDWVVKQNGKSFWNGDCIAQITNSPDCGEHWLNVDCWVEARDIRLWTIDDAKDGDVLAYVTDEEDLWIMIYRSLYEPYEGHVHYHALLVSDNFFDKGTCCICIDNLKPATKEQRDLLFQKMKEAGYEWNGDKKELKKIEVTNKESEEKRIKQEIVDFIISSNKYGTNERCEAWLNWLEKQGQELNWKHLNTRKEARNE